MKMLTEINQDSVTCLVTQKVTEQEFGSIRNDCGAWILYTKGGTFVLQAFLCLFRPSIQNIPSRGPSLILR